MAGMQAVLQEAARVLVRLVLLLVPAVAAVLLVVGLLQVLIG
jgi:hypothetical protein